MNLVLYENFNLEWVHIRKYLLYYTAHLLYVLEQ